MSLSQPVLNATPFAINSVLRNTIPLLPDPDNKGSASFDIGFPPETMVEKIAGGISPSGKDFNGIFHHLSQHQVWLNAGGAYKFNADLANALGGYHTGAILASNDGLRFYVSTVDENLTDFNTDMTGWKMIGTSELEALLDTLQTNINNEALARAEADTTLQTNINNEADTRLHDDNVEREARIAGDEALDRRVDFLESKPDQPAIGFGQAWINMTSSRFSGVTYPNTTGKPLEVAIFLIGANDNAACDFFVGGEFIFSLANRDAAGQSKSCSVIIPVDSNCRIDGAFTSWRELR